MLKLKPLQFISIWFSFFGQFQLLTIHTSKLYLNRFLFPAFKISYMIVLETTVLNPIQTNKLSSITADFFAYLIHILIYVEIIESCIQSKMLPSIIKDVEESFSYLESFMGANNQTIIIFAQRFRRKFGFCTAYFLFEFLINVYSNIEASFHGACGGICMAILPLYRNMAIAHIVLFIDLRNLVLMLLIHRINPMPSDSVKDCIIVRVPRNEALLILRRIKIIHSNVHKISESITQRFGCSLIAVFMNVPFIFIRNGYIIYKNLSVSDDLHIIRKLYKIR